MIPIMEKGREAKNGGRRRLDPGELLRPGEVQVTRGATGVVNVATEMEAVVREKGAIDEVTVLKEDPLSVVKLIGIDVMVDLKRVTTTSRRTTRGRSRVDSGSWPASPVEPDDPRRPFSSESDSLPIRRRESLPVWFQQDGLVPSRR